MRPRALRFQFLTALALALAPGVPVHAQIPAPPTLKPGPCWFTPPALESALCGIVSVPEDSAAPEGRSRRLPVVVLRSRAATPAPDPVLLIEGGPGASAFGDGQMAEERMDVWWELTAPFRRTRDVALFDPRGVGRAEPDTNCYELEEVAARAFFDPLAAKGGLTAERAALKACAERLLAAGVDPAGFSTPRAAGDVAALITALSAALGAPRVNLFAVSYGTRVALEVLRDPDNKVRAAVLDAVYPPDVNAVEDEGWLEHRALARLFADCRASRACQGAFPQLEARFVELVRRLDRAPLALVLEDRTGAPDLRLDGRKALAATLAAMAEGEPIARLPLILDRAIKGHPEDLARIVPNPWLGDAETSEGVAFSTECRETVNPADPARILADRRRWSLFPAPAPDSPGPRVCPVWPSVVQAPSERQPVSSDRPILLLSGSYDPVTPPEWAERAAFTLPAARQVVFRAAGHVVTATDACALNLAANFLEHPEAPRLAGCPSAGRAPVFLTR